MMCLSSPCYAANSAVATPAPSAKKLSGKADATTAKPAVGKNAARNTARAKSASSTRVRTEAEVSGLSSETSEQLHARLNLSRATPARQWWIRTGGGVSKSRTIGKKNVHTTDISTFNLDTEYRRNGKNSYQFVAAAANKKSRTPRSSAYYNESGYYMFSAGYGRMIFPGVDLEAAAAYITRNRGDIDRRLTPVYSVRLNKPLSSLVTLDSDTLIADPWTPDSLVDSRVNLTYKLSSNLAMRLSYVANNILGSSLSKTEWDKTFRISLVFGRGLN